MGFKARHRSLDSDWAINILLADLVGEVVRVDIFKIEAADCPDILPVNILETTFNNR